MTPQDREELLSAYLDDAVSAEERTAIEAELAASAELRELLEEFRAMRRDLHTLPQFKLNVDLSPAVLKQAERAVLSGTLAEKAGLSDGAASTVSPEDRPTPSSLVRDAWLSGAGWRRLLWPAVAIATVLLISVFRPHQVDQRQLADNQAESTKKSPAASMAQRQLDTAAHGELSIGAPEAPLTPDQPQATKLAADKEMSGNGVQEEAGSPAVREAQSLQSTRRAAAPNGSPPEDVAVDERPSRPTAAEAAREFSQPAPQPANLAGSSNAGNGNSPDANSAGGLPAPAPMPMAAPLEPRANIATDAPQLAAASNRFLDVEVDASFLQQQKLEKLLGARQLVFTRLESSRDEALDQMRLGSAPANQPQQDSTSDGFANLSRKSSSDSRGANAAGAEESEKQIRFDDSGPREQYVVRLTGRELRQVLADLEQMQVPVDRKAFAPPTAGAAGSQAAATSESTLAPVDDRSLEKNKDAVDRERDTAQGAPLRMNADNNFQESQQKNGNPAAGRGGKADGGTRQAKGAAGKGGRGGAGGGRGAAGGRGAGGFEATAQSAPMSADEDDSKRQKQDARLDVPALANALPGLDAIADDAPVVVTIRLRVRAEGAPAAGPSPASPR